MHEHNTLSYNIASNSVYYCGCIAEWSSCQNDRAYCMFSSLALIFKCFVVWSLLLSYMFVLRISHVGDSFIKYKTRQNNQVSIICRASLEIVPNSNWQCKHLVWSSFRKMLCFRQWAMKRWPDNFLRLENCLSHISQTKSTPDTTVSANNNLLQPNAFKVQINRKIQYVFWFDWILSKFSDSGPIQPAIYIYIYIWSMKKTPCRWR